MNKSDLFPYQLEGVDFLSSRKHALLGDEPGLGKTPQACVAALEIKAKRIFITCLAGIKINWARELVAWGVCKQEEIFTVWTKRDKIPKDACIVICNYELVISAHIFKQLQGLYFDLWIGDEAHKLKSMGSKITCKMLKSQGTRPMLIANCNYKWCLTGSFMENRPIEMFPLLRMLAGDCIAPYKSYEQFARRYCEGYFDGEEIVAKGACRLRELAKRIKPFFLRREYKDVYDMPPLIESACIVKIELPKIDGFMLDANSAVGYAIGQTEMGTENTNGATLYKAIGIAKTWATVKEVKDLLEVRDKVMVFAYHREVIDILTRELEEFGAKKIYGGVSAKRKDELVQSFINDPEERVRIVQITSAGTGVDGFQKACNTLVFAENDWSIGKNDQGIGRVFRLLQENTVYVVRIIAEGTFDEVVLNTMRKKERNVKQFYKKEKQMSLEDVIKENTAALLANTAALLGKTPVGGESEESKKSGLKGPVDVVMSEVVGSTATKGSAGAKSKAAPAAEKASAKPATKGKAKVKQLTHDDVVAAGKEVIQTFEEEEYGKARVREIIAEVVGSACKIREVPEEHINAVVEALKTEAEENQAEGDEDETEEDDLD